MKLSFTTIVSTVSAFLAVAMGVMTQVLGCHLGDTDFSAVCTASWVPSELLGYGSILFGVMAVAAKMFSPGGPLANLFGEKAVVLPENDPRSGVGTVTPDDVARP